MEFHILGPVKVWREGVEVPLDGAKQRTVLAALLLAGDRPVSDARLCELLWGEHPPATYAAQLYNYMSRLRKYLGDEVDIVRQWTGYLMRRRGGWLDSEEFDRLTGFGRAALLARRYDEAAERFAAALELWHGPALSNVTEFLAEAEGHRMAEARMAALEGRVEADLALGRHADLVPELTSLVAQHPLHERLRSQLMTALVGADRQADALAVYHHGRRTLDEELGVGPGAGLSESYRAILAGTAPRPGWPGVRPAMLPPAAGDFHGRTEQLRALTEVLTVAPATAQPPVLVTGMAGAGKTALAQYAAQLTRASFPDGQLYADLGATRGHPVEPDVVLGWFLRGLGNRESTIPRALDERAQLFRSQLAGRRMLVLLDDVANYAQVRPLLPGEPACRVLVTSRSRLAELAGPAVVEVGPLGREHALELLATIVGPDRVAAEPVAALRIVELCGELSLGVRIVGARLASRPHWSLGRLADRLADERTRLDELRLGELDVRERLEASYVNLAWQGRLALRRLSLLDAPNFPSWATAEVLGVPWPAGEEVTEHLVDARLLEVADLDGWRRFHDLVRIFAREKADRDDRIAVSSVPALRSWRTAEAARPDRENVAVAESVSA